MGRLDSKGHLVKATKHLPFVILALCAFTQAAAAQQEGGTGQGQRPPKPPLLLALDANSDGIIDASEIDNAAAALRALDKNGDGDLSGDEIHPPRRAGAGRGPEGQGDPEGQAGPVPREARPRYLAVQQPDEVRAIRHVLTTPSLRGAVNLTAPTAATNLEFTKALGAAVHRPTLIPLRR